MDETASQTPENQDQSKIDWRSMRRQWREQRRAARHEMHKQYHGNALGALVLIFIGLLFLFNNFGILPWSVWSTMWRFWPVILIFFGIELLFGRSRVGMIIVLLIGIAIVVGILYYALYGAAPATMYPFHFNSSY